MKTGWPRLVSVLILIASLGCNADSDGKKDVKGPPHYTPVAFDTGIWQAGEVLPSWLLNDGRYESSCERITPIASALKAYYVKAQYTIEVDRLAVELQYFSDGSCTTATDVQAYEARFSLVYKVEDKDDGTIYIQHRADRQFRHTASLVYLSQKDVDFLKEYGIEGNWVPESLNSVLGLNKVEVEGALDAISDSWDSTIASLLKMKLFPPEPSSILFLTAKQVGRDLLVKSGPGFYLQERARRFTKK